MKHTEGRISAPDGLQLYYQSWHPEQSALANVAIAHGLGGHSGQFQNAVDALVPEGYAVYALDFRGHGRSPGQRGYIEAWSEFRSDVAALLRVVQEEHPGSARFLWGHSLGGTIALDYALRSPGELQGLILTAPALGEINLSPVKLAIGQVLSRVFPRFSLKVGIRHDLCAQDASICAAYDLDPLRHEYGSARLATEFFTTVSWISAHAADLQVPLLLMHGGADQITLPEGSRAFFEQVMFADKQYLQYPGNFHDLHVDINYHEVMRDIQHWIEKHVSPLVLN